MGNTAKALVVEAIGTFMLSFAGAGAILTNQLTGGSVGLVGIALAHAFALSIAVTAAARISGGHINPAITFAIWIAGKISTVRALAYWVAQLIGASLAGYLLLGLFDAEVVQAVQLGTPGLREGISFGQGVLIEAVLTFMLAYAVFATAVDEKGPKHLVGFSIGLVLIFDILMGGPLTGAAMNPSRAFGPALAGGYWQNQLVYWIGPLIGAGVVGLLYGRWLIKAE